MINSEGARLGAEAAHRLAETGLYTFEPGLTDAEFTRIEREYGFEFAEAMHREFDDERGEADENWNPRATVPFWRDLV
ncbi:hypothetical protein [Streptomyces sp. NPDC001914]|uniref:hypothetical protein n=1 Tax=Streptomyces sp. NPDC001914 TaxID=3364623 RepID=UPI00369176F6